MSNIQKKSSCYEKLKRCLCPPREPVDPNQQQANQQLPQPHQPLIQPQECTFFEELQQRFIIHVPSTDRREIWIKYFTTVKISSMQGLMIAFNNSKTSSIGKRCNAAEFIILQKLYEEFNSQIRDLAWTYQQYQENLANQEYLERNILIIGITGQGKSTFINSFANFANNITYDQNIRYRLTDDTQRNQTGQSVTREVTPYRILKDNVIYNFIDTPGLADTDGVGRDQEIIESISNYLIQVMQNNKRILHQVIIVSQSSTDYQIKNRSPNLQQLAMLNVLKLFGKNMSPYTVQALTFSDFTSANIENFESRESLFYELSKLQKQNQIQGTTQIQSTGLLQAQLLQSQEGYDSNGTRFCQLQNSVFFATKAGQIQNIQLQKNIQNYQRLSEKIRNSQGFSLEETVIVINERRRITEKINSLNMELRERVKMERIIQSNLNKIKYFETKMEEKKDFTYTRCEPIKIQQPVEYFVTNCNECEISCHKDCKVSNENLRSCTMMMRLENGEVKCDSCKHKVESHTNQKFLYKLDVIEHIMTYDDLKAEFQKAQSETEFYTNKKLEEEQRQQENDVRIVNIIEEMRQSFNNLYSSALYQLDLTGGSLKTYIYRFFKDYDKQLEKYFEGELLSTNLLQQTALLQQTTYLQKTTLFRIRTEQFQQQE